MRMIEKAFHWAFAIFMAFAAYFVTIVLVSLVVVKLEGLKVGVQPPGDFHSAIGPATMSVFAALILYAPYVVATVVGVITAPFAQRRLAAVVMPVMVFAAVTAMYSSTHNLHGLGIETLSKQAASCALPGALFFLLRLRQQSRIASAR